MPSMPPIWVVSLERAQNRRASVVQAFGDAGLPFEIVDAVDGETVSPDDRRRYSPSRAVFEIGRELTEGELGCALSHLRLLRRIVDGGIPEALIVEDDVTPSASLALLLAHRDRFPADRDVVTFFSFSDGSTAPVVESVELEPARYTCTARHSPYGAQCYLITAGAARRVLDVAFPIRTPYDELLFRRRPAGLRVYGVEPAAVTLERFESEIAARPAAPRQSMGIRSLGARLARSPLALSGKVRRRLWRASRRERRHSPVR